MRTKRIASAVSTLIFIASEWRLDKDLHVELSSTSKSARI